jgi:plasmid stabilization system protein ParE
MPPVTVRPLAWREINAQLNYLEEQAGLETAERFLDRLIASFDALAHMQRMGAFCGFRKPAARRLRRWPVKEFED